MSTSFMSRPYTLTSALPIDTAPRRVLSRDAAIALGQKLLNLVSARTNGVTIEHVARSVTKVANSSVLAMDDGDIVKIRFMSTFGSGIPVYVTTNQLNDAMLKQVVARAAAMEPPDAPDIQPITDDPDDAAHFSLNARPLPRVSLWHDSTARAMDTARGTVIPEIVQQVRASRLNGAATVGLMSRSTLYMYRLGLTSFAEETDCEVTVTARTLDNKASGWSGQAHRDWARITPHSVVARAVDLANRSQNAVALEPGRRVAILGPAAVAQLMYTMARLFDFFATKANDTPFGFRNLEPRGRHTKLGERIFDSRLMMVSDPADPDGGYAPFFEDGGRDWLTGFPTPAITWIDHGILKHLACNIGDAVARHLSPAEDPYSIRVDVVPGTQTATIEEMIANCKEGVYVNRFSDVALLDRPTGMMTGVTRDGCFLIKDGKLTKPVVNFRFTDSPVFAFNQIEMIGKAERAAFGNSAPLGPSIFRRGWPRLPVIVPPMMIRDFNFSQLASAV